jgi:DNA replication factor GINS
MITYNDIYECLRKERYSEQLQPLPKKFMQEVADYIAEKKKLANQQGDLFSDEIMKIKKQLENSVSIFNELMLLRKKKLLGLVFVASETGISKRDFENMFDFEKELFDKIILAVQDSEKIISELFNSNNKSIESDKELKLILFLEDVEEFVGLNGEGFGPFKKGDIVNLPKQIADILISGKKAEVVLDE